MTKMQVGDSVVAANPIGKQAADKAPRFGADLVLVSLADTGWNGAENMSYGDRVPFLAAGPGEYEVSDVFIRGIVSEGPNGQINTIYTLNLDNLNICHLGALAQTELPAETLEAKRQALIYRVHDEPSMAKQEALREFLATVGLSLARGANLRPAQFNGILAAVEGSEHDELVNQVVLRSQSQAIYSKDNAGHFGLNLRRYAHFTSPIRRYADLIVHRALIAAIGLGKDGLSKAEEGRLEEIAALISATERRAMAAERDTVDRLIAGHLATRIDEIFTGRISGVTKSGLFVQLPQFGADGFVPVSTLGDDYYIFDEAAHALVGERTKKRWRLGDRVRVKVVGANPAARLIDFKFV